MALLNFFRCALVILVANCVFPTTPTPVSLATLTASYSLAHYWKFNGDVKDTLTLVSLFNQHNASAYVADRFGRSRSSLFLDNGYIQMPVGLVFAGDFSTSMWLNLPKPALAFQTVYSIANGARNEKDFFTLGVKPGSGYFQISFGANADYANTRDIITVSLVDSGWFHLGVVMAYGSSVSAYLNGTLVSSTGVAYPTPNSVTRANNYFGLSDTPLNAYLDDGMFFQRALTADEMYAVAFYTESTSTTSATSTATTRQQVAHSSTSVPPPSGLVRYWKFNRNVQDSVTLVSLFNQHNASLFVADRRGNSNSALFLNSGFIQMPVGVYFTGGDHSTSLWLFLLPPALHRAGTTQFVYFLGNDLVAELDSFALLVDADGQSVTTRFGLSIMTAIANQLSASSARSLYSKWFHLGVTLQGSLYSLFINGSLAAHTTVSDPTVRNVTRAKCFFGRASSPLSAYLDDVMFFDRALTSAEMRAAMQHYERYTYTPPRSPSTTTKTSVLSGLTHAWNFDANYVDRVTGAVGIHNASSFVSDRLGKFASALLIDGGYVQLLNGVYLSGDFSTSLWFSPLQMSSVAQTIYRFHNGQLNDAIALLFLPSGYLQLLFTDAAWQNQWYNRGGGWLGCCGSWHHVAVTLSGQQASVYTDGELSVGFLIGDAFTVASVTREHCLFGSNVGWELNGQLDDVLFFSRALSATEIRTIYSS